jgi:hypothetical protein
VQVTVTVTVPVTYTYTRKIRERYEKVRAPGAQRREGWEGGRVEKGVRGAEEPLCLHCLCVCTASLPAQVEAEVEALPDSPTLDRIRSIEIEKFGG